MFSRRLFLLGSLGLIFSDFPPQSALAKKARAQVAPLGPHSLSRQSWPPAIQPDYVGIVDRGYALFSDQSGRLAIVDLKREDGPHVVGELTAVGKKIIDLTLAPHRAYAIAFQESNSDSQYALVTISITPSDDPGILSRLPLSYFSDPVVVAAGGDAIAVGGAGLAGENIVIIYNAPGKRKEDMNTGLATLTFDQPVARLDMQERQLVALSPGAVSQLDVINVFNPRQPEKVKTIKLEGNYPVMARSKDVLLVAGQRSDRKYEAKLIAMRPTPHVVSELLLPVSEILDVAAQKGQFLVLGNQINRQVVVPVNYNKSQKLAAGEAVLLPAGTRGAASKARIVVQGKDAYVASDWGGVQVLNIQRAGWQYMYSHTIPRMPAAAVAVGGQHAVLGGADLKLYDISRPERPLLLDSTDLDSTVKALSAAGSNLLVLTRDQLTLRRLDKPGELLASAKVTGVSLSFDSTLNKAYVITAKGKEKDNTVIYPLRVSNLLTSEKACELPGIYRHSAAASGQLLLAGLNNLALYNMDETAVQAGSRQFPNLAIRDLYLAPGFAVITAVDQNLKGFLLIVSTDKSELTTLGSIDLPQDAVALAVSGKTAVVVGRGADGKDLATIVDISNNVAPKVLTTFAVLEAAAAVTISKQLAIVAGRGLEVLSL